MDDYLFNHYEDLSYSYAREDQQQDYYRQDNEYYDRLYDDNLRQQETNRQAQEANSVHCSTPFRRAGAASTAPRASGSAAYEITRADSSIPGIRNVGRGPPSATLNSHQHTTTRKFSQEHSPKLKFPAVKEDLARLHKLLIDLESRQGKSSDRRISKNEIETVRANLRNFGCNLKYKPEAAQSDIGTALKAVQQWEQRLAENEDGQSAIAVLDTAIKQVSLKTVSYCLFKSDENDAVSRSAAAKVELLLGEALSQLSVISAEPSSHSRSPNSQQPAQQRNTLVPREQKILDKIDSKETSPGSAFGRSYTEAHSSRGTPHRHTEAGLTTAQVCSSTLPLAFVCDICGEEILRAIGDRYECRACDFDVCGSCFSRPRAEDIFCAGQHVLKLAEICENVSDSLTGTVQQPERKKVCHSDTQEYVDTKPDTPRAPMRESDGTIPDPSAFEEGDNPIDVSDVDGAPVLWYECTVCGAEAASDDGLEDSDEQVEQMFRRNGIGQGIPSAEDGDGSQGGRWECRVCDYDLCSPCLSSLFAEPHLFVIPHCPAGHALTHHRKKGATSGHPT